MVVVVCTWGIKIPDAVTEVGPTGRKSRKTTFSRESIRIGEGKSTGRLTETALDNQSRRKRRKRRIPRSSLGKC